MHHKWGEAPGKIIEAFSCPILLILLALCVENIITRWINANISPLLWTSQYAQQCSVCPSCCLVLEGWNRWSFNFQWSLYCVHITLSCSWNLTPNLYLFTVNQCSHLFDISDESWYLLVIVATYFDASASTFSVFLLRRPLALNILWGFPSNTTVCCKKPLANLEWDDAPWQ